MVVGPKPFIRRAAPGEHDLLATLAVRAWNVAVHGIELTEERRFALKEKFLRHLSETADGVRVAELADGIRGWGGRVPDSPYISDLWVEPEYHGQGIGGHILDALMAAIFLDGFAAALIGTHADNIPAIRLYEKMGFEVEWRGEEWSESLGCKVMKVGMRASFEFR